MTTSRTQDEDEDVASDDKSEEGYAMMYTNNAPKMEAMQGNEDRENCIQTLLHPVPIWWQQGA